jgi:Homeodomain-like domain
MPNPAHTRWQHAPLELAKDLARELNAIEYYRQTLALEAVDRGASITDVAEALDVSRQTIYNWQKTMLPDTREMWREIAETRCRNPRAFDLNERYVSVFAEDDPDLDDETPDPLLDGDAEKVTGGLVDAATLDAHRRKGWRS